MEKTEIAGAAEDCCKCEKNFLQVRKRLEESTIVFLGAGRVATHLVPALVQGGGRVTQVWSRTMASAHTLAAPLGLSCTNDLAALQPDADVYVLSVPDEVLPSLACDVVARVINTNALFLHTAGSVSMDIWRGAGAVHYGILYPLQTFSKKRAVDMAKVPLFVEGSDDVSLSLIERIAYSLSDKVYHADSLVRARLHVSAVFACNFANAMYGVAHRLLSEEGIPFEVLLPLIEETAAKVRTLTPREAQTGPAIRGDKAVMESHLEALAGDEELRTMYTLVSNYIDKNR